MERSRSAGIHERRRWSVETQQRTPLSDRASPHALYAQQILDTLEMPHALSQRHDGVRALRPDAGQPL
jgi:hypothetical protein